MPIGIHSYYAGDSVYLSRYAEQRGYYYLGAFVGDHFNDEPFKKFLHKVESKLASIYGWGGFQSCWAPFSVKEVIRLTPQQKFNRMKTLSYNKYQKRVRQIVKDNSMFADDYLK